MKLIDAHKLDDMIVLRCETEDQLVYNILLLPSEAQQLADKLTDLITEVQK